jgi:hypothetical protein
LPERPVARPVIGGTTSETRPASGKRVRNKRLARSDDDAGSKRDSEGNQKS